MRKMLVLFLKATAFLRIKGPDEFPFTRGNAPKSIKWISSYLINDSGEAQNRKRKKTTKMIIGCLQRKYTMPLPFRAI